MIHQAYITAIYILGVRYHSGQWSTGYRLQCIAADRMFREHNVDIGRVVDFLPKSRPEFRKYVAYFLFRLRKHRWNL